MRDFEPLKPGCMKCEQVTGMFRHSAAVWQAEANIPFSQIAQFLGHTDSRITERVYSRFSPSFLANAAEALTW